jgi:murein DD-endopeptidase MepM/ murein hydrolase activator NlpD
MAEGKLDARSTRKQAIRRKAQRRHSHFYQHCSHWSFNRQSEGTPIHWYRERWMLAATALLITLLSGFLIPAWATAMKPTTVEPVQYTLLPLALPKIEAPTLKAPAVEDWRVVQVRPGQTLSDIFQSQGLSLTDLQHVVDSAGDAKSALHHIQPGQEFDFLIGRNGSLEGIRFDKDEATRAVIRLDGATPAETTVARTVETREQIAHGVIDDSLFAAAAKAGLSNAMVIKLADLFKYDVDFVQDLRVGDSFTVVYDNVYRDGTYLREGDIVAAEFVNQGHRYTAYRFKRADGSIGWFSEDGRPIQKSFLRIPVDFTRISSPFSAARMHPILGLMRAHKGVDYAAPTGTPIHAAGDGVIKFRGWMNGYGNFVIIQHDTHISTAYGHMSRFATERIGQHVHQGDIIGYVGMTGLATGPHLHYEFRVDGVQRNPQTVTLPKPEPLAGTQMAMFQSTAVKPQLARLTEIDNNYKLARADSTTRSDD